MKLTFTADELAYMRDKIEWICRFIRKSPEVDLRMARTASKMRYKFTPNAHTSSLSLKERSFLVELLNHRQQMLVSANDMGPELDLIQTLLGKVE